MFLPSLPIILPFISSLGSGTTETVVSEADGTAKIVEVPERYDIYVKFETSGNASAEVGKLVTVYTKSFKASGYVVNIESEIKGDDLPVKDVTAKGAAR